MMKITTEQKARITKQADFEKRFRMSTEKYFFMKNLLRKYLSLEELVRMGKEFEGREQMCVMIDEPPIRLNTIDVSMAACQVAEEVYGQEVNPLED